MRGANGGGRHEQNSNRKASMNKRMIKFISTMLTISVVISMQLMAGEGYKRNANPPTDGRVGSNYTPAYASSPIQHWADFRPDVVKKELEAAHKNFGVTMLRVYVNTVNFFQDKERLLKNVETFIGIADKVGIKPGSRSPAITTAVGRPARRRTSGTGRKRSTTKSTSPISRPSSASTRTTSASCSGRSTTNRATATRFATSSSASVTNGPKNSIPSNR
jgi:hypothetical protein